MSSKIRVTQLGIINSIYQKTEKKKPMKTERGLAVKSSVFKVIGRNKEEKRLKVIRMYYTRILV